ncbi:MAG: hypothetical protein IPM41_15995 [Sphingomonadales bacterium]|nr:hypothetical protein [Sphingomonadales bacterium]
MSDKYTIWRPEYGGHAPPKWRDGMKWTTKDFMCDRYDATGTPDWSAADVYCVEPEALNSPNDDAHSAETATMAGQIASTTRHRCTASQYPAAELAKHGITLAEPKDWATELWADLFAVRGMPSAAKSTREGRLDDEDQAAIALIRERVVLKDTTDAKD